MGGNIEVRRMDGGWKDKGGNKSKWIKKRNRNKVMNGCPFLHPSHKHFYSGQYFTAAFNSGYVS